MFDDFTGLKSACVTVLRILSENDGFNVEDKYMWLSVPLYQALVYSMSLEKEFWHLFRDDSNINTDGDTSTNEFDWCIVQLKGDFDSFGPTLKELKRYSLKDEHAMTDWRKNRKKNLLKEESYFSNDDFTANCIYLIKSIRDNIVHANCVEVKKLQKFLCFDVQSSDTIMKSSLHVVISLINEICVHNYEINKSSTNYSAKKFSDDFVRKFEFWLNGTARFG